MPAPPFLRSPPFPGIAVADAAISVATERRAGVHISDAVLDSIAAARVGGAFWGERRSGIALILGSGLSPPPALVERLAPARIGIVGPGGGGERSSGATILPANCDPWALVERADCVCADAGDELALVAGLLGRPVYDAQGAAVPDELLRAAVRARLSGATYRNCFTGEAADIEEAIALLADWRRHFDGNHGIAAASGMAFWKQDAIRRFLWNGTHSPPLLSPRRGLKRARRQGGALAVWPSRVPATLAPKAAKAEVPIVRIEDGFLRSRGLGAALHPPGSVVIDRTGLYYDARASSDLERLLAEHSFPAPLVARAAALRRRLRATGMTKYGAQAGASVPLPPGQRTVLAVGQVDDDLSVRLGGAGIGGNLDFLGRVRRAEPDAWIIYRPHPDVQAGHRRGHLSEPTILRHADAIDTGAPLMGLVEAVDAVHVLSSLTGFEALMRDRPVTVHGMPFYAGWGLTHDLAQPIDRRGRALTLDQLVAGALILYPRYLDPVTGLPCGPEIMVSRLASDSASRDGWLIRLRRVQGKLRRIMTLSADFIHG
ncbi:MAG: beta-3-deoxy-D-manno-oct-2-ulosonic acid transferase [Sphingobium sp.]